MSDQRGSARHASDVGKQAAAIAACMGVERREVLRSTAEEYAVVVHGGELARSMVLCVRSGMGFPDAEARHAIVSEHLATVTGLPQRQVRGNPICSRLDEHLPAGSLRSRVHAGPLSLGEAITVLLAVFDVLQAAHRAGFGGLEPSGERIRFRADGCPVLSGLWGVGPLTQESATRDAEAFLRLVRQMASAVADGSGRALLARVERVMALGGGGLREELLTVAPPVAMRLTAGGAADGSRVRAGVGAGMGTRAHAAARVETGSRGRRSAAGAKRRRSARWDVVLDGDPFGAVRTAVVSMVRRRPKLVLAIGAPVVTGVLVVAAAPPFEEQGPARDAPVAVATAPSASSSRDPRPATSSPTPRPAASGDPRSGARGCGEVDLFELTGNAGTNSDAGTEGAKPDALSPGPASPDGVSGPSCVTTPEAAEEHEAGGVPSRDDPAEAALAALSARGDPRAAGASAEVTQRWGDAALVRIVPDAASGADSEPASLLLLRNEAGWRIRAVYS
ncbi:hypothetical protein [Leifsonia sp. LS1]|uniref:hypothetical protein n=1 Tax=Leifsonia sp. LS1 TaxID=2828483 RepID=UPI001CFE545E|nr:hypothetical protein [Leifsonia sp. LS1]